MDNKHLRTLFEKLQSEIQHTSKLDAKGLELLKSLDSDILRLLERSEGGTHSPDESMISRLQAAIDYMEITHPTLTMTLSEMMTILSNAGI